MKKLNSKELENSASKIAKEVLRCHIDQRWELYLLVGTVLKDSGQNFQATHFRVISGREMGIAKESQ
jgi:hypothetical protein